MDYKKEIVALKMRVHCIEFKLHKKVSNVGQ